MTTSSAPQFFDSPAAWRVWLAEHHATSTGLVLGLRKVAAGQPPLTYQQALDEALCYGWIDGFGGLYCVNIGYGRTEPQAGASASRPASRRACGAPST